MTHLTVTRRQFLRSTTQAGLAVTLATALSSPARPVQAGECSIILNPQDPNILRVPDLQELLGLGLGAMWVAGRLFNTFARNFDFGNLPPRLQHYFRAAGGEWKSNYEGMRIWKTIPEGIRRAGAKEIDIFLKYKEWSHTIPKSMGGPTTAENGIFELAKLNRIRGGRIMRPDEIAAAKAVIRSAVVRSIIRQTIGGMVKGALGAIVVGGLLLCLEYGLLYAEGKIGWEQMVGKIIEAAIYGGVGVYITTGLIVGLAMLFPVLLPIFTSVLFSLQIVSMVFLGPHLATLVKGWWTVLEGQERLDDLIAVLKSAKTALSEMLNDIVGDPLRAVWVWLEEMVGVAWTWFAGQTRVVQEKAGEFVDALAKWDYLPSLDVGGIGDSIVHVVTSEYCDAISTTEELLRSISDYRKSAILKVDDSLLVV